MCFISLDRRKVRLFIDVLFVYSPLLDQEISPVFYNGGRPLVSILNHIYMFQPPWLCLMTQRYEEA